MHIEAVTVCVEYSDFLAEVAHFNSPLLDRWIIVTTDDDEQTREVCRVHDLECITTGDRRREGSFNKGRMVDRGLQHLSNDAWRLHLDSDIALPASFRRMLAGAHLQTQKIYGCDRLMVTSSDQWDGLLKSRFLSHTHCSVNLPEGIKIGTRWALSSSGYIPIGYFQMWHSDADEWRGRRVRTYPISHGDACRTDVQFALKWDRLNRELLPEIVVAHLDGTASQLGANWQGRSTPPFRPVGHPYHYHYARGAPRNPS